MGSDRHAMAQVPILTLSDISLNFGGAQLFNGLSLAITAGERICLVGRNGSGKSTLLKVMAGLIEIDQGERFLQPGRGVGYMEQDPDFTGFATLQEFAEDGLDIADHYKVEIAMEGVKLDPAISPDKASGGERRKAALAKLLASEQDLMLLDEPTNHLDIESINWLEDYLKQTRKAFLVISHDRAFLRNLTRVTLWIDRGEVRRQNKGFADFEAWRDKVFEEEDLQRHKLDRLLKAEGRWAVEGISARRKRNMGRVRRLQEMRADRSSQIMRQGTAKMELDAGPKSGRLVVEARDISKTYGGRGIVKDFSLRVMRGERIALIGPNGAGKTTLLNMLTGALEPDTGTVKMGTGLEMAVFDQNRATLVEEASLWEVLTGDAELGVSGSNDQIMVRGSAKHVVGYLKEFLFTDAQARATVSTLSGGERARLLLAKIMARASNLLVLDEPTNDLDVETLDLLQELIEEYDGTVLLVSHDRDFIDRVATTTIAMDGQGRAVVYAGGYTDHLAQLAEPGPVVPPKEAAKLPGAPRNVEKTSKKMSFTQENRLKDLPAEISKLEAEIAKLTEFLSDPDLFATAPTKFAKASQALTERQTALEAAETEWLELEDIRETLG